ncbi:MAG: hypothetical protein JXO22_18100 [Phycisphaerae bacterium]|nr:hypothetical protein [Phycisphaerae bacterium]
MTRFVFLTVVGVALAAAANGEPYWIAYEGNDYPENEGWWHIWGDEPTNRSLEDGCLVLDAQGDISVVDYYVRNMYGTLDPDLGEIFMMSWRLLVEDVSAYDDPSVTVVANDGWAVGFDFAEDYFRSSFEYGKTASFQPGVFHEHRFESRDMREYDLYVDGQHALSGYFWDAWGESRVSWGDGTEGVASVSRWDYVSFGVVPEPHTLSLLSWPLLLITMRKRSG